MTGRYGSAAKDVAQRRDLHAELTQTIVAQIEAGAGTFKMPWHRAGSAFALPKNALTQATYRGSNILWLWIAADAKSYAHPVWATYKQYQALGGQVRAGEKSSLIIKYGEWIPKGERETAAETGEDGETGKRLFAKAANVFNIDQVDLAADVRGRLLPEDMPRPDLTVRLAQVDAFLAATKAEFREGGQRAFYRHRSSDGTGDFIQMPLRNLFTGTETSTPTETYESTRLHEAIHWVGAEHRLNRKHGARFGDNQYAYEELIAEIGAAYLCAQLDVANVPRPDHAQYIAGWLTLCAALHKVSNREVSVM